MVRALWFRCETWISAVLAGAFLMLFFIKCLILSVPCHYNSCGKTVLYCCCRPTKGMSALMEEAQRQRRDKPVEKVTAKSATSSTTTESRSVSDDIEH